MVEARRGLSKLRTDASPPPPQFFFSHAIPSCCHHHLDEVHLERGASSSGEGEKSRRTLLFSPPPVKVHSHSGYAFFLGNASIQSCLLISVALFYVVVRGCRSRLARLYFFGIRAFSLFVINCSFPHTDCAHRNFEDEMEAVAFTRSLKMKDFPVNKYATNLSSSEQEANYVICAVSL